MPWYIHGVTVTGVTVTGVTVTDVVCNELIVIPSLTRVEEEENAPEMNVAQKVSGQ